MVAQALERDGQAYLDDPIYAHPKKPNKIALSVGAALGSADAHAKSLKIAHKRVKLVWLDPDGKGGLKERKSDNV